MNTVIDQPDNPELTDPSEQKMDSFNLLEYENDLKKKQLNKRGSGPLSW